MTLTTTLLNEPLTPAEYADEDHSGCYCPLCGCTGIESAHDNTVKELSGTTITWSVQCQECGAIWTEHYELAGYADLKPGE